MDWKFYTGDLLITFAILILYVEILKATRLGPRNVLDHTSSIILFVILLAEFVAITGSVISFVDVIGGFAVSVLVARRDAQLEAAQKSTPH